MDVNNNGRTDQDVRLEQLDNNESQLCPWRGHARRADQVDLAGAEVGKQLPLLKLRIVRVFLGNDRARVPLRDDVF